MASVDVELEKIQLTKKQNRLKALLDARSEASCNTRNQSATDVQREAEIEELEEEIAALEKKLAGA